jgi:hypothetical protein
MGSINLSNSKGRDAMVATEAIGSPLRARWVDTKGRSTHACRMLRSTLDRDVDALARRCGGLDRVGDALVAGDPEVDIETFGRAISETSRAWVDPDGRIVHRIQEIEVVRNPDGSERERRPRKTSEPNVATETPLRWSGKLMKKSEVYNRFVFSGKLQVVHVNGLTHDFLLAMARELEEKQSVMLVGAGPKSSQPLVFHRNGMPYRGFLEGWTKGEDQYCLILHLSNMELKAPATAPDTGSGPAQP